MIASQRVATPPRRCWQITALVCAPTSKLLSERALSFVQPHRSDAHVRIGWDAHTRNYMALVLQSVLVQELEQQQAARQIAQWLYEHHVWSDYFYTHNEQQMIEAERDSLAF